MERDTNQMSQSPSLCRSGCGFYGSPKTDGLCSKCYKDALKRKQANPAPPPLSGRNSPTIAAAVAAAAASTVVASTSDTEGEKSVSSKDDDLSTASPTVPSVIVTPPSQEQNKQENSKQTDNDCEGSPASPASSEKAEVESVPQEDEALQKEQKKKKNRCNVCRKKVGLTGFPCRCSGLFCSLHRYSNEHNCTFDYKELGAQEIRKNNPLVVGEKIKKI